MPIQIDKAAIIAELKRVSQILGTTHLGYRDFEKLSAISRTTVVKRFGSWNSALQVAGLFPAISKRRNLPTDDDLLINIITLSHKLKKVPSSSEIVAHGKYSDKPYVSRWGSFTQARKAAYQKYGMPPEIIANSKVQIKSPQHRQKQSEQAIVDVANSLKPHLLKIKSIETRAFVEEAIKCFEAGLYRSAVLMSWIGAMSILYDYVIANKLAEFNVEASRNPKWKTARTKDDLAFDERS